MQRCAPLTARARRNSTHRTPAQLAMSAHPGSRLQQRTLLDAIASDEPTLWLLLACGARVPAHRELLQFMSSCVKGLPPGRALQGDWGTKR